MLVINVIDSKTERATRVYLFASFMAGKSTTTSNMTLFEDLHITQIG